MSYRVFIAVISNPYHDIQFKTRKEAFEAASKLAQSRKIETIVIETKNYGYGAIIAIFGKNGKQEDLADYQSDP